MPELPEVEVTCRGMRPRLVGRTINKVRIFEKRLRLPVTDEIANAEGRKVVAIDRRAKFIIVSAGDDCWITIHLGMTGHIRFVEHDAPLQKHDHAVFCLSDGFEMRYNDPRRFGLIAWTVGDPRICLPMVAKMGPEPLSEEFSATVLWENLQRSKKKPIKTALMDNSVVVGVGNIYASETLFASGISPDRKAGDISLPEAEVLVANIKSILQKSIASGGTTIRDFSGADGKPGYYVRELSVYGHEGEPCLKCRNPIASAKHAGRSTYYCPHCQH